MSLKNSLENEQMDYKQKEILNLEIKVGQILIQLQELLNRGDIILDFVEDNKGDAYQLIRSSLDFVENYNEWGE